MASTVYETEICVGGRDPWMITANGVFSFSSTVVQSYTMLLVKSLRVLKMEETERNMLGKKVAGSKPIFSVNVDSQLQTPDVERQYRVIMIAQEAT